MWTFVEKGIIASGINQNGVILEWSEPECNWSGALTKRDSWTQKQECGETAMWRLGWAASSQGIARNQEPWPGTDLLCYLQRERGPATALILDVYPPRLRNKLMLFESGVSNCQDLVPDGLKRSWGNNNRNKVHNKCNALESSPNHPPPTHTHTLRSLEKSSSRKPVLGAKKIRDCWFKPLSLW